MTRQDTTCFQIKKGTFHLLVCYDMVATCTSVDEGVSAINTFQPDLVFLDMEIGAEEGFEVLDKIADINFETIVVTMHPEYAKQAFRYNVTDFLTKPVQKELLKEAVERILNKQDTDIEQQLSELKSKINSLNKVGIRLADENDSLLLSIDEISYCESKGSRTIVHLTNGESHVATGSLGDFGKALEQKHFTRIHNQYLINLLHLKRYRRASQNVVMEGWSRPLSVSNNYKGKLIIWLRDITVRSNR